MPLIDLKKLAEEREARNRTRSTNAPVQTAADAAAAPSVEMTTDTAASPSLYGLLCRTSLATSKNSLATTTFRGLDTH